MHIKTSVRPNNLPGPKKTPVPPAQINDGGWHPLTQSLASDLAYCSALIYEPFESVHDELSEYEDVATFKVTNMEAVYFLRNGHGVLVFRGTTPSNLRDWLTDLRAWRIGTPGRHSGFARGWEQLAADITWHIQHSPPPKGLICAGHSMGGALAFIAAERLQVTYPIRAVMTFGAPSPGGRAFAEHYNALRSEITDAESLPLRALTYRFELGTDLFTWIAPNWLGYRHVGRRMTATFGGWDFAEDRIGGSNTSSWGERQKQRDPMPSTGEQLYEAWKHLLMAWGWAAALLGAIGKLAILHGRFHPSKGYAKALGRPLNPLKAHNPYGIY